MNQRAIIVSTILFIGIVCGLIFFTIYMKKTLPAENPPQAPITIKTDQVEPIRINGVHVFQNDAHSVLGEVVTDSTCTLLDAKASVASGTPQSAIIALTTLKSNDATCEKKATARRFIVKFTARKDAHITATLDGAPVILNLVEGDPSKTLKLDDELNFKG